MVSCKDRKKTLDNIVVSFDNFSSRINETFNKSEYKTRLMKDTPAVYYTHIPNEPLWNDKRVEKVN